MTGFAIVSSVACVSYVYLGVLTLVFDRASAVPRSFAVLCSVFALWSFGAAGQNLFLNSPLRPLFDKLTYTGAELYALSGAVFFLHLTGNAGKKGFRLAVVFTACPVAALQIANWGWNRVAVQFPLGFWYVAHHVVVITINLLGLAMTARWGIRSRFRRERIQARLIVLSAVLGVALGLAVDYSLGNLGYPSLTSSIPLVWMAVICVAVLRYGLMRFTSAQFGREIISGIEEPVFLIDAEWRVSDLNPPALHLTEREAAGERQLSMEEVFVRAGPLIGCLKAMICLGVRSCSRAELLRTQSGGTVLVRAEFHTIPNRWGDRIGILCICRSEHNLGTFIARYGLSRRETDILRYIVTGCSQAETANSLGLGLPTVKTHTAGLYNKLGISNRNELYAMLRGEGLGASVPHGTGLC